MTGWRAMAEEALQGRDTRDSRGTSAPTGPTDPIVPASETLKVWHGHLSAIDQFVTPSGWQLDDWLKLTDTAFWIYEQHCAYAVRNGWTALDLFGVRPGYPERGGLADLLNGARNLKLLGGKAYWSHFGASFSIGIGIGKGCTLLWELDQ